MAKFRYTVALGVMFIGLYSNAKCKGFEKGQPNFCASVKLVEKIRVEDGKCIFKGQIISYEKTGVYSFYEDKIDSKKDYTFSTTEAFCSNEIKDQDNRGMIAFICNDNVGLFDRLKEWFGMESSRPEYKFGTELMVSNEKFEQSSVKCPN